MGRKTDKGSLSVWRNRGLAFPAYPGREMGFARTVANRVIFLEDGKIVEENNAEEFFKHPKTQRAQDFLNKVMH